MNRTTCTDPGCLWRLAELTVGDDATADLMLMGVDHEDGRPPIHLYKHSDTRRYLNLAAEGDAITAWRYTGAGYERTNLGDAIRHAFTHSAITTEEETR